MATFATFDRELKLATQSVTPEAISAELAKFAKEELAAAIASGEASPIYTRYVNGREDAPEESVSVVDARQPGPIFYVFSWWAEVVRFALADLAARSPKRSGTFASSFIVIANDRLVTDFDSLRADDEVIITNYQPYVRKVQMGGMEMSVPDHIFDATRATVIKQFGQKRNAFNFSVRFLEISSGVHPLIPYILKGQQRSRSIANLAQWYQLPEEVIRGKRAAGEKLGYVNLTNRRAAQDRRSSAFRAGREFLAGRADSVAGKHLTYPALVMNMMVH